MRPEDVLTPDQMRERMAGRPVTPLPEQFAKVAETVRVAEVRSEQNAEEIENLRNKLNILKKGKKLTAQEIRDGMDLLFQKYDYSPIERLIQIAMNCGDNITETRICMFLTEFIVPKLKSIEVSGQVDHTHTVVVRRFGPGGEIQDTPVRRVPGLPEPMKPAVGPVMRAIDAEVIK